MRVPRTRVIACEALGRALESTGLRSRVERFLAGAVDRSPGELAAEHAGLAEALVAAGMPNELRDALESVVGPMLREAPHGLVVRSSAVYEDSADASFAGVFESWLGVTEPDELERQVLLGWTASWAPRAIHYMRRLGITPRPAAMALMIQPVVDARASGVIYTANPDDGEPWRFSLRAVPGLSVDLMSGSGVGDAFDVEWDTGRVLRRAVVDKPSAMRAAVGEPVRVDLSAPDRGRAALTDDEIEEVSRVALRLDEAFGCRLDVEFVLDDREVQVVQARPMTSLPPFFPAALTDDDAALTWHRHPFVLPMRGDSPPGFVTPLYAHLSDAELWRRYQPDDIVLTMFCSEVRDFFGYRFVDAGRPKTFMDFFDDPSGYEAWLDRHEQGYRPRWDGHREEIAEIASRARAALEGADRAADLIEPLFDVGDRLWDLNAFGWSAPQSLGWMCDMLLGHFLAQVDSELETGPLVSGGAESHTYAVTEALQELGRSAMDEPARRAFDVASLDGVIDHLREHPPGQRLSRGVRGVLLAIREDAAELAGAAGVLVGRLRRGDDDAYRAMRDARRVEARRRGAPADRGGAGWRGGSGSSPGRGGVGRARPAVRQDARPGALLGARVERPARPHRGVALGAGARLAARAPAGRRGPARR